MPQTRTPVKQSLEMFQENMVVDLEKTPTTIRACPVKLSTLGKIFKSSPQIKRSRPHDDNIDPMQALFDKIDNNHSELRENQTQIFETVRAQSTKIDNFRLELTKKFEEVGSRVESLESSVVQVTGEVGCLQRRLYELEQDKLESHMDISGVETADIDSNSGDMSSFARNLINSFQSNLQATDIQRTYILNSRDNKKRIVVVLKSPTIKATVMKAKRESKDARKIYFDHRMTLAIKDLFMKTHHAAKEKSGRALLLGGRVFLGRGQNQKTRIISADDFVNIVSLDPQ